MQDQTVKQKINPREKIVTKLKAAYKLEVDSAEDLPIIRTEFLAGFEALGDWHAEQGQMFSANLYNSQIENREITEENKLIANRHLLKAVALYNMAMASEFYAPRKDEENKSQETTSTEQLTQQRSQQSFSANQQRLIQKIKSIEDQMLLFALAPTTEQTVEIYWQKNQKAKNKLQVIRLQAREALDKISRRNSDDETTEIIETELPNVQHIYHYITGGQQQLVRELLDDCLHQLPPPEGCIYSIIVLGSLAREEATPYSDFEWAILFEDQGEARNAFHKNYFRRLAELLWIKVLNLGETTSRMMDIEGINGKDEETYGPIPKGFSFDGQMADGCHTPLGNRHHKVIQHKYELIGTPHEIAQFQQNTWEHKRGLSTVLSTIAVIQSNDAGLERPLIEQYETEMEQIWNTPEEKTDHRTGEVTHQTLIQRRSLKFLKESSESFQFRGGRFDKEAHYFDAKYHLYRLPNMLIDHLASYFGITKQKNLWGRIEAIWGEQGKAPNPDAVRHLKRTISTILTIRSMAYLRKGHRDDHILMFDPSHPEKNQHLLQTYLGINQALLFEIFYVLMPLQKAIENFVETRGTIKTLFKNLYYNSSAFMQARIHYLLLDYVNAAKLYIEAKHIYIEIHGEQHISVADTLNNVGVVYQVQGRYLDAIAAHEKAKRIYIATHGEQHISVADTLHNLGNAYLDQGRYLDAIAAYEEAKRIKIATHGEQHISVANTLHSLGVVYRDQGRYLDAIAAYKEAKRIYIIAHGEQHILVADTLHNLGAVYQVQSLYVAAITTYEAAMRIYIVTHGEQHISVADTLNNLGNVYQIQGSHLDAIAAHEEAKRIYIATHGEQHIHVATTLHNLGNAYLDQGRYLDAIAAYEEAKRIKIATHGEQHISVAETLGNLGGVYRLQGRYRKAIAAHEKAKRIYIATHGEQHISVADTLNNLGAVYQAQGYYVEAIAAYEEAKCIKIATHGEWHISVADMLNNLGLVYEIQGRYLDAIVAHEKAKRIYIATHGEQHISVANTLNNLGAVYQAQGYYVEAIAAYEEAKRIMIATHDEWHISVADTLNNLGLVYEIQGRYLDAIVAHEEAMRIKIATYGEQHISVADTLNNIGLVYQAQDRYVEAIAAYEEAKRIMIATHDEWHISVADTLNNLGNVYSAQGHYLDAIAAYEKAKRIYIATHGEQHISLTDTLNNLGNVYSAQGHYLDAIAAYEEAKCIKIATHGEQHISVADTLHNLGVVYEAQGRYLDAIEAYEKTKDIYIAIHGEQHVSVANTSNNLGNVFVEQKRFREARHLFQQAISIYQQFNHPNLQIVLNSYVLSYLREGNSFLLQKNIDIEQAMRCYQVFNQQNADLHILGQPVDPKNSQSHQLLANLFYQRNELLPTIEHYQILLRLTPYDVSAHQNLACMLHARAQIEKNKGDNRQYKTYLDEAKSHFETAIEKLKGNTGVCVEYAHFMWKNREHFQIDTIIAMLQKAITLDQIEHRLSYGMMERPTVIEPLQALIDEGSSISFKAIHLTYYLFVQIHCETNQIELANGGMSLLAVHVIEFNEGLKNQQQQLAGQFNELLQHASQEQSEAILNRQQEITKELEEQTRLANKLVELSQAAIEVKQKEITTLSAQSNTEVEQQIEMTEVKDVQSQMSPQPLSERSASPAQLISQFFSVIRQPTDENPVSQQTQTSEQIADADRVERVTEEPEAEHDNARKLTQ